MRHLATSSATSYPEELDWVYSGSTSARVEADSPEYRWRHLDAEQQRRASEALWAYHVKSMWVYLISMFSQNNLDTWFSSSGKAGKNAKMTSDELWTVKSDKAVEKAWIVMSDGHLAYGADIPCVLASCGSWCGAGLRTLRHDIVEMYEHAYEQHPVRLPERPSAAYAALRMWEPCLKWVEECRDILGVDSMLDAYFAGAPLPYILGQS